MLKKSQIPAALALGAALWLAAGCTPPPPPANTGGPYNPTTRPTAPPVAVIPSHDVEDTAPVRDAITLALKQHASLFPKGTELETVSVHDGVATLDFSSEFNKLANMGDTTESEAQKRLRATLAKFPAVEKMVVTVKGKSFDSQMTDWTTPIPVRDAAEAGGDSSGTASEKHTSGGGG